MKNLFYLVLFSIALSSCHSNEKLAREKLEAHIQKYADEPSSYEFSSMERVDSITASDSVKITLIADSIELLKLQNSLAHSLQKVKEYEILVQGKYPDIYEPSLVMYKNFVESEKIKIGVLEKHIIDKNDTLAGFEANPEEDEILYILYTMGFRIKNEQGILKLKYALIQYFPKTQTWGELVMADDV
jgi:hypothetical protein